MDLASVHIRNAVAADVEPLARLWLAGWRDAHATLLPAELARHRTFDGFRERLGRGLANVRLAELAGEPVAFWMRRGDELYQFYVAAAARGTGLATTLIADAEGTLAAAGVRTAWLDCAIGNERAARFYGKCGWRRTGTVASELEAGDGTFAFDVWRYEKSLGSPRASSQR
jgi:GNAT superfamily N-acetyltransferase